jgi:hypothetical protein
MRCSNCDSQSFIETEYRMPGLRAPALECTDCHVLLLDETAVRSEEDRESVRLVAAERARHCAEGANDRETARPGAWS